MPFPNSRPWAETEDQALEALWGQARHQDIANALQRSVDSVTARAARLGLKGEPALNQVGSDRVAEFATRDAGRQFVRHFTAIARKRGWRVHEYQGAM